MSNKVRKPKKKTQPRPSYTKDRGYCYVESVVRSVKYTLRSAAESLHQIDRMDTSRFTVNEIKEIEKTVQDIRLSAPGLSKSWDLLRSNLTELTKQKKIDTLDYRPLVDDGLTLTTDLSEKVLEPMQRINSIIDRVLSNSKDEKE